MSRLDWRPTGPRELLRYFGWLGAGLTAPGALRAAATGLSVAAGVGMLLVLNPLKRALAHQHETVDI